jgi:hypothetical protein
MFIAALFTMAKLQNQVPSTDGMDKENYIQTMEYYSVIKKNEIMSFAGKWMELETMALRKIDHTEEDK